MVTSPIAGWFMKEKPTSMDENWGYPHFRKPPYGDRLYMEDEPVLLPVVLCYVEVHQSTRVSVDETGTALLTQKTSCQTSQLWANFNDHLPDDCEAPTDITFWEGVEKKKVGDSMTGCVKKMMACRYHSIAFTRVAVCLSNAGLCVCVCTSLQTDTPRCFSDNPAYDYGSSIWYPPKGKHPNKERSCSGVINHYQTLLGG